MNNKKLKRMIRILLFLIFISICSGMIAQDKPKAYIFTTGGTIASRTSSALLDGPSLIKAIPQLANYAEIEVEELVRIGSSKMRPDIWLSMVKRIREVINENPDLSCIIITHGTDTMEETAFFLNLTHKSDIPILIVGSMRSSDEISADGSANLLNAIRVGTHPETKEKGVLVVMNDNITAGRDLYKQHNRRVDAFSATEKGFLGFIDPETVTYFRAPLRPHTVETEFDIYQLDSLPKVDLVSDFAGFDTDILEYFLGRPTNGLVVGSFAGGRMSAAATNIYRKTDLQKPVVVASNVRGGRIMGSHSPNTSVIIANELPPNKARILLMLALTKTSDPKQIQQIFDTY